MAAVKYKLIKNFFSKEELNILQKYCNNRLDENKDYQIDPQSFSPSWYKDPLMNSFLEKKLTAEVFEIGTNIISDHFLFIDDYK